MSETKLRLLAISLLLTVPGLGSSALAQEQTTLDVRTTVQKEETVVDEAGNAETRLVDPDTVLPGDKVIYTITFRNAGDETADDVVVTNPIDPSLTYVDGSAFGPGTRIEFSADGGQSFASRDELTVSENGVTRAAEPADYTHVRWTMEGELEAGSTGVARFSAVVD